jgi:deazaflavin-dependent oxidoreductase (nitroreductase family)
VTEGRPGAVVRRLLRLPTLIFRAGLGRVFGERFLMLTHDGRRSGRRYRTVLEVIGRLPTSGELVVMAGFGPSADWLLNARAGGARTISVGGRQFRPAIRLLPEDAAAAVLADYERRHRLVAPIIRRVLSGLVGWRYTGSVSDRHRLVRQLPLVAFRPAADSGRDAPG